MPSAALIRTRFTASSTAAEVLDGVDLAGLRAIVTGATSGLGAETARALTAAGAEVTLAVRDAIAGAATAEAIARSTAAVPPRVLALDLADARSVARFVAAWDGPLNLLVNNAGLVTGGLERTPEGWELQLATNHLGHFALATGLHGALASGASQHDGARIVALSSTAHMRAGVDFDDLQFERRAYDPQIAYAQSKTANVLFAVGASRRWADDGIVANAVNPGGVRTGLQRHFTQEQRASLDAAEAQGVFTYKTVEQGAATTMVAAVHPLLARTGGPLPRRLPGGVHRARRRRPGRAPPRREALGARPRARRAPVDGLGEPASPMMGPRTPRTSQELGPTMTDARHSAVLAFFDHWSRSNQVLRDSFGTLLHEDRVVWDQRPVPRIRGVRNALRFIALARRTMGLDTIEVEILSSAVSGDRVVYWREYLDLGTFTAGAVASWTRYPFRRLLGARRGARP